MRHRYTILIVAVLLMGSLAAWKQAALVNTYENFSWSLHPTAQKAFSYGERHFNSRNNFYDIDKAEYFFLQAAMRDPNTDPYLFHELSRIQFLRGNLENALSLINIQIALHGAQTPNSYYVRGLIEGYRGDYTAARADYSYFVQQDPSNWAAMNDYAWVLLKDNDPAEALKVAARGTSMYPNNAWLWNSLSIAQFELGSLDDAYISARKAAAALPQVTEKAWLTAYPGNDPKTASAGIQSLQTSVLDNMHRIQTALASSTVQ